MTANAPFLPSLGRHAAKRARAYGPGGVEDVGPPEATLACLAAAEASLLGTRQ